MKFLKNQRGVAMVLELILVAVVAAVLAIVGYRYYQSRHTAKPKSNSSAQTAKKDPYAGWKTYTSTAEGISFKYPPTWMLTKDPMVKDDQGKTYEKATFTGPNIFNFQFGLQYLDGIGGGCDDCSIFEVDPVTIPNYVGGDRTNIVIQGRTTGQMASSIGLNGDTGNFSTVVGEGVSFNFTTSKLGDPYRLLFTGSYQVGQGDPQVFPYATFKDKPEIKDAKLLLQSLKY